MKRGTQRQIAKSIGKSDSTVSRNVRKNDIPTIVEGLLIENKSNQVNPYDLRNPDGKH